MNGFKNLITGVPNFFTGLLGKKKNGYYLELDEAAEATKEAAKQAVSKAQEAVGSVVSKAQEAVEPVTSKAQEAVGSVVAKAQEAVEPVTSKAQEAVGSVTSKAQEAAKPAASKAQEAAKPAASKAKKTAKSAPKQADTNNGTKDAAAEGKPNVQLTQGAVGAKPEPVNSQKAKAIIQKEPTETTFAPKYLAVPNTSNGRRRPGANMSSFLDMANQVKTSK
ncbi:MAG: hypothetical protein KME49_06355 [Brasilonema octagenarum HA4186-MV1]|jgi:uncharacterized protein YjbJ (UPF0337 family)|nr:hypothetical protein [Brasilonema octagenarum HA4186-MV1]